MSEHKQLFVGGDLSGIQKFLYNISSKKAAVSLKGRSEHLNRYMKEVSESLKEATLKAGSQKTDIIYCSGGKFYLITDYSSSIISTIDILYKKQQEELWAEHMGQLGLNIAYTPFTKTKDGKILLEESSIPQKPGELWKKVNETFGKQKNQKFKSIIIDQFEQFFKPIPVGGDVKVCAITGIESSECVKEFDEDNNEIYVLPSVKKQIKIGEELRNKEGFKTFEEYAKNTKLGVLRMDVDGLGKRFIKGFESIEEYEKFSNELKDFFEIEIKNIQKEEKFKPHLNIIYAGGDDLFVVGRWDKVIDFAERIHNETESRFKHEGISISGGVAIVHPKFPIAKAAELAGEAEEAAKKYDDGNGNKKNAFHFLGKTISWDKEFDYVKKYKDKFLELIKLYDLSKSILHKIMLYDSIAQINKERKAEGKSIDYSYKWHIAYYLARYKNMYEKNEEVKDFCNDLNKELANNDRNLEKMALAARWAELLLKYT